ncbi:MAG TPA: hypothetical protein VG963_05745, partial [Polyangiaceae bacterium]|nr:hypothetical protein [Polyangiaceae bacterium]
IERRALDASAGAGDSSSADADVDASEPQLFDLVRDLCQHVSKAAANDYDEASATVEGVVQDLHEALGEPPPDEDEDSADDADNPEYEEEIDSTELDEDESAILGGARRRSRPRRMNRSGDL